MPSSKPIKKIKIPPPSKAYEREMRENIIFMLDQIGKRFTNQVFDALPKKVVESFEDSYRGNYAKDFMNLTKQVTKKLLNQFSNDRIERMVEAVTSKMDRYSKQYLMSHLEDAIGIDTGKILDDEGIKVKISALKIETEMWIRKLRDETLQLITADSLRIMAEGGSLQDVMNVFNEDIDKKKVQGRTVARTQVSTYNALTLKARAENIGISKGIWRTAEDERVRKAHIDRNGKEFDLKEGLWSNIDQQHLLPGVDINCRCTTELILP